MIDSSDLSLIDTEKTQVHGFFSDNCWDLRGQCKTPFTFPSSDKIKTKKQEWEIKTPAF